MSRFGGTRRGRGPLLAGLTAAVFLQVAGAAAKAGDGAAPSASGGLAGWLLVAAPAHAGPAVCRNRHLHAAPRRGRRDGSDRQPVDRRRAGREGAGADTRREPDGRSGRAVRIQYGGPVEPGRGFFLHSSDYAGAGTVAVTGKVSLSGNHDVLRALAEGRGPARGFLAVGYAAGLRASLKASSAARTGSPSFPTTVSCSTTRCGPNGGARWTGAAPTSEAGNGRVPSVPPAVGEHRPARSDRATPRRSSGPRSGRAPGPAGRPAAACWAGISRR